MAPADGRVAVPDVDAVSEDERELVADIAAD